MAILSRVGGLGGPLANGILPFLECIVNSQHLLIIEDLMFCRTMVNVSM